VHVDPVPHDALGALLDVELDELPSTRRLPPKVALGLDEVSDVVLIVRFQPDPLPVLSMTVVGTVSTTLWSMPSSVSDHDRLDGGVTVSVEPLMSAVAVVVADASSTTTPLAVTATAAAPRPRHEACQTRRAARRRVLIVPPGSSWRI
jgi:hypothetical protein